HRSPSFRTSSTANFRRPICIDIHQYSRAPLPRKRPDADGHGYLPSLDGLAAYEAANGTVKGLDRAL
ncbi:MAG: hypothetical protein AABY85_05785, partial [Gemmatimonadota bacterium]